MKPILNIICILSLCIFSACEKDADVELPAVESKLVVSSFISPTDTIVKVGVTISQPLYNNSNYNQYSVVSNATVQINDGTNFQTLTYNVTYNYYFVSTTLFPLSVGATYYLTVTTPDGKSVSASTSIPSSNQTLTYSADSVPNPDDPNRYYFSTEWNDDAGSEDYYRLVYYNKLYLDSGYQLYYSNNLTDKNKDGSTMVETFETSTNTGGNTNASGELQLIHASKEYYLYHSKLSEAAYSGGPFSEPVQMYTNINRGFGVFAGYNPYIVQVTL